MNVDTQRTPKLYHRINSWFAEWKLDEMAVLASTIIDIAYELCALWPAKMASM